MTSNFSCHYEYSNSKKINPIILQNVWLCLTKNYTIHSTSEEYWLMPPTFRRMIKEKVQSQFFEGTKILVTPWNIGRHDLKVPEAVTQFSVSDETRRFLTSFTQTGPDSPYTTPNEPVQTRPSYFYKNHLISSSHPRLGLPSSLFQVFPTKSCRHLSFYSYVPQARPTCSFYIWHTKKTHGDEHQKWSPDYTVFLKRPVTS